MTQPPDRTALDRMYSTTEAEDIPAFLRELYPQFLRFWQYKGTGGRRCPLEGPGYFYVPAEDPEAPLNYELKIRRPPDQYDSSPTRTALYRLRNIGGTLLYVGVSDTPLRRWSEHAKDKPWWPEVTRFSLEWFDNRHLALTAEAASIRSERPLHNVLHNKRPAA